MKLDTSENAEHREGHEQTEARIAPAPAAAGRQLLERLDDADEGVEVKRRDSVARNNAVQPPNNLPVTSPYKTTRPDAMPIRLMKTRI
jgi:hypothetical protein